MEDEMQRIVSSLNSTATKYNLKFSVAIEELK
jgi:hypothetical protein